MEKILDVIIQNVQDALKKFQDTKNKEYEKTQRQINELGGALNRHQSETENTINREINELKLKIKNIKEEVTQDMDNLRKKESNRNTKHSGRPLQQTRTSGRQNLRTRR
jgi:gas vesicle protein